jgi:SH3-like domain-containing protein
MRRLPKARLPKVWGIGAAFVAAAALFSLNSATAEAPARFMSLRVDGVEGRQGPSADQRVAWLYQRTGLPVMVLAEREGWKQVRDPDGDEVWIRSEDLAARRTVYVREETALRRSARSGGQIVAYLMPGVIGAVTQCDGDWRRVAVGGRIGWVQNSSLWGGECAGLDAAIRP